MTLSEAAALFSGMVFLEARGLRFPGDAFFANLPTLSFFSRGLRSFLVEVLVIAIAASALADRVILVSVTTLSGAAGRLLAASFVDRFLRTTVF